MNKLGLKSDIGSKMILHTFFIVFCLMFILPFAYIIAASFSNEDLLRQYGFKLIPMRIDLSAYKYVFTNPKQIIDSYKVTSFSAIVGTILGVLIMSATAYPLSRQSFKYRKQITFFVFFTMLFSGGLIPSYILITQYLGLKDSVWVYIFPSLASAWYIMLFRTFFSELPQSLTESAKLDGATELRIFASIIFPLSKPILATIALFTLLNRWNDWYTSLIYIQNQHLFTLQYLLQRILREAEFVTNMAQKIPAGITAYDTERNVPTESMRFAMCIVATGPMLFVFPFFQKYFTRGLTIGAVKG